jgi:predicted Zn-dependent peptidase
MLKFKKYDNGLKLTFKRLPGTKSVSTGIFIGAGSCDENDKNNGISHYIEHMLFKGTSNRTSFEIADSIDSIGAQINAFTTKEMTCYYTKSTTEHTEKTFEILSDLYFNSLFDEKECAKEKKVIIEEIAMVEDSPEDLCIDCLQQAFYGNKYLGRTILGSQENVQSFTKEDVKQYMDKYYTAANTVISVAGAITFNEAEKLADKYFASLFKNNGTPDIERTVSRSSRSKEIHRFKEIEQVHFCIGFPSSKFNSRISNEIALMNIILGGGMSSRLFQKIREEKGLAYNVYSYPSAYRASGIFTVYAAVNPVNVNAAARLIAEEITNFMEKGITNEEFIRGKEQLKSALIFSEESSSSIMNAYGRFMTLTGKVFNLDKKLKRINSLTLDEINAVIKNFFDFDRISVSYVGKEDSYVNIMKLIQS